MMKYDVGYIGKTKRCGLFQVVVNLGDWKVVQFLNTGTLMRCSTASFAKSVASLNDVCMPSLYGVGYIGKGEYNSQEHRKAYSRFACMFERVYSGEYPSYEGVTVCKEWHNFQNFAKWFYEQENHEGYDVDKDVVGDGTIYSPSTCCMLPSKLNKIFVKPVKRKEGFEHLPRYVTYQEHKKRYVVQLRGETDWRDKMYSKKFRLQDYPTHEAAIEAARIHAKEKGIEFYSKVVNDSFERGEISEFIRDKALEKIILKHKEI